MSAAAFLFGRPLGAEQPVKLHIALLPGRRFVSTLLPKWQGTVVSRFTVSDGWDWYHVVYDKSPDLLHQARRDSFTPLKLKHRPVYGPVPNFAAAR